MNLTHDFAVDHLEFLWHTGWQATLLIPLVLGVQALFRNHISPTTKHALWALVLVRLTFPSLPESQLSAYNLIQRAPSTKNIETVIIPAQTPPPPRERTEKKPTSAPIPYASASNGLPVLKTHSELPSPLKNHTSRDHESDHPAHSGQATIPPASSNSPDQTTVSWQQIATTIWLIGVIVLTVRILNLSLRFHRHLKRETTPTLRHQSKSLNEICLALGYRKRIQILATDSIHSPAIYGFFSPTLLVPKKAIQQFDESELRHILAHEVAHLKRFDPLWNLWATLLQVIHWPNPFVWFAVARLRGDRELATDYLALRKLSHDESESYGETILKALQTVSRPKLIPGLIGIAEDRRCLRRRFKMIANFNRGKSYPAVIVGILSISVIVTSLTDPTNDSHSQLTRINTRPAATSYHEITVTVVDDSTDAPLSNVLITSAPYYYEGPILVPQALGQTDRDGKTTLKIPLTNPQSGIQTLFASSLAGYASQTRVWRNLNIPTTSLPTEHVFRLRKGRQIGGRIHNPDGSPAIGLEIFISGSSSHPPYYRDTTNAEHTLAPFELGLKTDSKGRWSYTTVDGLAYLNLYCRHPLGSLSRYSTGTPLGQTLTHKDGLRIALGSLLDETSTITLAQGFDVAFRITNRSQQPIHDATVTELSERRRDGTMIQAHSSRRGLASFPSRTERELLYIIEHPDYASRSLAIVPSSHNGKPIELTLDKKSPLRGRIISPSGAPVANALLRHSQNLGEHFFTWSTNTDRDGEFLWENAPTSDVFLSVRAPGYPQQQFHLLAGERISILKLQSKDAFETTVKADVSDSSNGRPLKEFSYSYLNPLTETSSTKLKGSDGSIEFKMSSMDLRSQLGSDGISRYRIAVSAPGFESATSREIDLFESNVRLEINLSPLPRELSIDRFQFYTPTGQPAMNAKVYVIGHSLMSLPNLNLSQSTNKLEEHNPSVQPILCDEDGKIQAATLPSGFLGIYAVGNRGSIALTREQLIRSKSRIILQPHGTVMGQLTIAEQPIANRSISLTAESHGTPLYRLHAHGTTNKDGRFGFSDLPPGPYRLTLLPKTKARGHLYETYQQRIEIEAGKTVHVDYSHEGRKVVGLIDPDSYPESIDWDLGTYYLKRFSAEISQPPPFFARQSVSRSHLQRSVRDNWIRHNSNNYPLLKNYGFRIQDGRFTLPAVEPGVYQLELHFPIKTKTATPWHTQKQWFNRTFDVIIPEGPPNSPIILPRLDLNILANTPKDLTARATRRANDTPQFMPELSPDLSMMDIRVYDLQTGLPIANAIITTSQAFPEKEINELNTSQTATTDATGKTTVRQLSNRAFNTRVETRAKGYAATAHSIRDQPLPRQLDVRLERARTLSGQIVSQSGDPLPGVKIKTSYSAQEYANRPTSLVTNEDGRWTSVDVPISAKDVTLYLQHPFMALAPSPPTQHHTNQGNHVRFTLHSPTDKLPPITMAPGGVISGQVLDENGNPIEGATVGGWNISFTNLKTDPTGNFIFPGALLGEHNLVIEADAHAPQLVTLNISPNTKPLRIILKTGLENRFLVTNSNNQPIEGARIMAFHWERTGFPLAKNSGLTDDKGQFVSMNSPPEAIKYMVSADGYETLFTNPIQPSDSTHTIQLEKALEARFEVVDANDEEISEFRVIPGYPTRLPLDENAVEWFPRWTKPLTSQRHRKPITFRRPHQLPMGTMEDHYVFRIEAHGHESTLTKLVTKGDSPVTFRVTLPTFDGFRGVIVSSEGMPLANERLRVFQSDELARISKAVLSIQSQVGSSVKTDAQGRFQFKSNGKANRLFIATASGIGFRHLPRLTTTKELTIQLRRWGHILGRLSNEEGPIAHRLLGFRPAANDPLHHAAVEFTDRVRTDKNGQFSFDYIPPGEMELIEFLTPNDAPAKAHVVTTFTQEQGKTTTLRVSSSL